MPDPRRSDPAPDPRAATRKPWTKPALATLATGSAAFSGGGSDDTVDLS